MNLLNNVFINKNKNFYLNFFTNCKCFAKEKLIKSKKNYLFLNKLFIIRNKFIDKDLYFNFLNSLKYIKFIKWKYIKENSRKKIINLNLLNINKKNKFYSKVLFFNRIKLFINNKNKIFNRTNLFYKYFHNFLLFHIKNQKVFFFFVLYNNKSKIDTSYVLYKKIFLSNLIKQLNDNNEENNLEKINKISNEIEKIDKIINDAFNINEKNKNFKIKNFLFKIILKENFVNKRLYKYFSLWKKNSFLLTNKNKQTHIKNLKKLIFKSRIKIFYFVLNFYKIQWFKYFIFLLKKEKNNLNILDLELMENNNLFNILRGLIKYYNFKSNFNKNIFHYNNKNKLKICLNIWRKKNSEIYCDFSKKIFINFKFYNKYFEIIFYLQNLFNKYSLYFKEIFFSNIKLINIKLIKNYQNFILGSLTLQNIYLQNKRVFQFKFLYIMKKNYIKNKSNKNKLIYYYIIKSVNIINSYLIKKFKSIGFKCLKNLRLQKNFFRNNIKKNDNKNIDKKTIENLSFVMLSLNKKIKENTNEIQKQKLLQKIILKKINKSNEFKIKNLSIYFYKYQIIINKIIYITKTQNYKNLINNIKEDENFKNDLNIKINEYEKLYQNLEQKLGEISIKALDCNKCSYLLKNNISTHLSLSSSFLSINVPNNFIPKQPNNFQSFNNDDSINELSIEKNNNNQNEYYYNYLSKNEIEIKNKIKNLKSIKESRINNLQNEIDNLIEEINNLNN